MASYFIGERVHVDMPGDNMPEGIPVINDDGIEEYFLPEDMPWQPGTTADAASWRPDDVNEETRND